MRRTGQGSGGGAGPRPLTGPAAVRGSASGYWRRRGLPTEPAQVAVAPAAPLLLLAVLAAAGRRERQGAAGVLLPHPCASWYAPQAHLLGQPVRTVPVPAECGGVPDPFALLETVRRARADGEAPHALVLSVADDVTGTAAPPELLHEVCEAAVAENLLLVSDETWRDTSHAPDDTVVVSPAQMLAEAGRPEQVVVLTDLGAALPQPGLCAGVARFSATRGGALLGEQVHEVLGLLGSGLSERSAEAAEAALSEPAQMCSRRDADARRNGRLAGMLHGAVTEAGATCRPPRVGRHVYADLDQLRARLAARGITDAPRLEAELVRRLGPYAEGGHRFGDDPRELRVRLSTEALGGAPPGPSAAVAPGVPTVSSTAAGPADAGPVPGARQRGPTGPAQGELPGEAEALAQVQSVLADLTDGSPH
ncbi:aminotransferase class I/II-fold pyridoxal phosphate-dependent enzyme [Streptomyces reniochalinae]|uniref:Aminotransferase class I/II-fold pyridoxal phosphate-dependent enzyme n=1 Tax=Streptomyces reniochalinae TaxID=2250578 RepID=A0A367EFM2_9ACTN|nr:aminotransferase class I/II-fold pyridoxal phosphate-dependent enzyme [Streptomyces reniochalinae]RCG16020.1 aminotransferase class I/II-fold pyridoxal phosphate-dependent enzyme [Streptomyces reniochalinae]